MIFKFCFFFLLAAGQGYRPTFDRTMFDFLRPKPANRFGVEKFAPGESWGSSASDEKPLFSVYKRNY